MRLLPAGLQGFGTQLACEWAKVPDVLSARSETSGSPSRSIEMLGWIILFALISVGGELAALSGRHSSLCLTAASVVFAVLFVLSLLTIAVRRQAHE